MHEKKLNLVVDMFGCPNRCLHCWLGHMPNKIMKEGSDTFIMDYFSPFFDEIAYYSWLREPDYCDGYKERWKRDLKISKNAAPERFELASFYRIVRDDLYIPFLRSVGVKKVQLTFFGIGATQDKYVGRKGAYKEIMTATDLLIKGGIIPRWQCFINEDNKYEIVRLYEIANEIRQSKCPGMEFFVHEGTCDGENRKLYPIRIEKHNVPDELKNVYLDFDKILSERECLKLLKNDFSNPCFTIGGEITLNVSNEFNVYYNFTHMSEPWIIGNLKTDAPEKLVQDVITESTPALNASKKCTWSELAAAYGDPNSDKVFSLDDYKIFLFNKYLDHNYI